jgi:four helix bundle protein
LCDGAVPLKTDFGDKPGVPRELARMVTTPDHERPDAWQKAMQLLVLAYAVARSLPAEEKYELSAQIRRASVSVAANIAEAWGRSSAGDRLRFLAIAQGSNAELRTLASATVALGYTTTEGVSEVRKMADDVGKLISGLRRYIRSRSS